MIMTCAACGEPIIPTSHENGYWRDDKEQFTWWHVGCMPPERARNATFVPYPGRREEAKDRRDA